MRALAGALLVVIAAAGCAASRLADKSPLPRDEARIHLYLLPLPPDAARLEVLLEGASAVREDGSLVPLQLEFNRLRAGDPDRERRLASGPALPGRYTGLEVRIASAALTGEGGGALGTVAAVTVPFLFTVQEKQPVVISLRLDHAGSVAEGMRFEPHFVAEAPPRPPAGLIALASARGSDELAIFDKVSGRIAGIVPTGRRPGGLALDSARRRAYVAVTGEDRIEAIGLLEQAVLARLNLRVGDEPVEVALTPDGGTLVTANAGSSSASIVDAPALVERARISVGNEPGSVLLDRAGRRAYLFNTGSSSITVIDVAARAVVATLGTEAGPLRGQLDRDGRRLYVIHRASPYLTIFDTSTLAEVARTYVGPGATALKVDPKTDRIYLARRKTGILEIFDPASLLPTDSIPVDGEVSFVTIDDEGNALVLTLPGSGEARRIGIAGKTASARTDVGADPRYAALVGER